MKEKKLAREERNKEKLTTGDWVMAEFYSINSLKSSRMHGVIDEFKKLMEGKLEVVQVNVDEEKALAEFYTIVHIPTYILLRKGEQLWRQSGELSLERLEVIFKSGERLSADMVLLSIGVRPNTGLASEAGIELGEMYSPFSNRIISASSVFLLIRAAAVAPPATPPTITYFII